MPPVPDPRAQAWERLIQAHRGEADPITDASSGGVARHARPDGTSLLLRGAVVLVALVLVVTAVVFWRNRPQEVVGAPAWSPPAAGGSALGDPSTDPDREPGAQGPAVRLLVHVVGRVKRPGVVSLDPGARVADAVRAAGGLRAGTDPATVNLARPVADGEQLVIGAPAASAGSGDDGPASSGSSKASGSAAGSGRVDLNAADESDLEALDGIGPVLAARIVDWRRSNGRFGTVDDLRQVSGIGPKTFEALKDQVRV